MKTLNFRLILLLTGLLIGVIYFTNIFEYLSIEEFKAHHRALKAAALHYPYLSPLVYVGFYIVLTSIALPVDIFLCMLGGFLFPQPYCTIYTVIGATLGAITLFLLARSTVGMRYWRRSTPLLQKMKVGFQEHAASYLLFLRFTPIFPFWLVNIAPAFFGISLGTFAWTSFIGVIPCAFVFTQAGIGLESWINNGTELTWTGFFNPEISLALGSLALFSLLPIVFRKLFIKP
jgi:uncharacterized membrane protein YdjX (TVP38/TMEM64 family)